MEILTRWQILAAECPAGYRDLAEFLDNVQAGRIPQTAAMKRLAGAFERVLRGTLEPADLDVGLGLRRKRGRPRGMTLAELLRHAESPLCSFIRSRIAADPKRRGARARALGVASERFGKDIRTVERAWKAAQPAERFGQDIARLSRMMHEAAALPRALAEVVEIARSKILTDRRVVDAAFEMKGGAFGKAWETLNKVVTDFETGKKRIDAIVGDGADGFIGKLSRTSAAGKPLRAARTTAQK